MPIDLPSKCYHITLTCIAITVDYYYYLHRNPNCFPPFFTHFIRPLSLFIESGRESIVCDSNVYAVLYDGIQNSKNFGTNALFPLPHCHFLRHKLSFLLCGACQSGEDEGEEEGKNGEKKSKKVGRMLSESYGDVHRFCICMCVCSNSLHFSVRAY